MNNETNIYRLNPNKSVPIHGGEQVTNSGGSVEGPEWDPTIGASRQVEIERARVSAMKEYEMRKAEQSPLFKRLENLEKLCAKQQLQLDKLISSNANS
jgi:hypothetical protein